MAEDKNADVWFRAAKWLAGALALFVFLYAIGTFDGYNTAALAKRASDIAPFVALALGGITFFTFVWRTKIIDRQVRQQREQIDVQIRQVEQQREQISQVIRQNDANDDAAYANLLIEGTKLLGEDSDQNKQAGVAILAKVIADHNPERFQRQAMNVLASAWAHNYLEYNSKPYLEQVRFALNDGGERAYQSTTAYVFETDNPEHCWPDIGGFKSQSYIGGKIKGSVTDRALPSHMTMVSYLSFRTTKFWATSIARKELACDVVFVGCKFTNCRFDKITSKEIVMNEFKQCNFSGATFVRDEVLEQFNEDDIDFLKERLEGSYFDERNPPITDIDFSDWGKFLTPRKRNADGTWQDPA